MDARLSPTAFVSPVPRSHRGESLGDSVFASRRVNPLNTQFMMEDRT
jgi:hypothetical protein